MRHIKCLCFLTILSLSIACSRKPSDETIAQDIDKKVAAEPEVQPAQVQVDAKAGKVTLKGKAKSEAARQAVEKIAMKEFGVTSVDDQVVVEPEEAAYTQQGSGAVQHAAERNPVPPPPPPPPPKPVIVSEGTVLTIRTGEALGSKSSQVGTAFTGAIATPISIGGKMVIPAGSVITGTVKEAKKAGRFKGAAVLRLSLDSVTVKGHQYNIETEAFDQTSTGKGKRTAGLVVGGTGAGAAIGGLAGGGTGAAIGALVGAGAGTIGAATGNRDINLPAESALSFKLTQPLTLKAGEAD